MRTLLLVDVDLPRHPQARAGIWDVAWRNLRPRRSAANGTVVSADHRLRELAAAVLSVPCITLFQIASEGIEEP